MVFAFGVSATGLKLSNWQINCVRKLVESGLGKFCCAIDLGPAPSRAAQHGYEEYAHAHSLNAPSDDSLQALAATYKAKLVRVERPESDVGATVREFGLDFIIDFSQDARRTGFLPALRFGVWTFVFGDPEAFTSQAMGFWEIYRDHADFCGYVRARLFLLDWRIARLRGTATHHYWIQLGG